MQSSFMNVVTRDGEEGTVIVGDLNHIIHAPDQAWMMVYFTDDNGDEVAHQVRKEDLTFVSFEAAR